MNSLGQALFSIGFDLPNVQKELDKLKIEVSHTVNNIQKDLNTITKGLASGLKSNLDQVKKELDSVEVRTRKLGIVNNFSKTIPNVLPQYKFDESQIVKIQKSLYGGNLGSYYSSLSKSSIGEAGTNAIATKFSVYLAGLFQRYSVSGVPKEMGGQKYLDTLETLLRQSILKSTLEIPNVWLKSSGELARAVKTLTEYSAKAGGSGLLPPKPPLKSISGYAEQPSNNFNNLNNAYQFGGSVSSQRAGTTKGFTSGGLIPPFGGGGTGGGGYPPFGGTSGGGIGGSGFFGNILNFLNGPGLTAALIKFGIIRKLYSITMNAIKSATLDAMEAFRQWDYNMGLVAAKAGGTAEDLKTMGDETRKIGMNSRFSAIQASEALKVLVEMGLTAKQSLTALPTILKFASIEEINMADASDILLGIIRGFGMPLEDMQKNITHVGDVIAFVSAKSATDIFGLGQAFKVAAGAAAIAGQSIEDIGAVLGTFSNAMIRGENAGFALAQIMGRLARVSRGGADIIDETGGSLGRARSAMRQLGITAIDPLTGKMKSLIDIFTIMSQKGITLTQIIDIFGIYTYKYASIAVLGAKNTEMLRDRIQGIGSATENVTGALDKMAKKIQETYDTIKRESENAATGAQISLGSYWKPVAILYQKLKKSVMTDISKEAEGGVLWLNSVLGTPDENESIIKSTFRSALTVINALTGGAISDWYNENATEGRTFVNAVFGTQSDNENAIKSFLRNQLTSLDMGLNGILSYSYNHFIAKTKEQIKQLPKEIPNIPAPDLSKKLTGIIPSQSDLEASYSNYTTAMQQVFSRIGGMSPFEAAFNKKNIDIALGHAMDSIQSFNDNQFTMQKSLAVQRYNFEVDKAKQRIDLDKETNKDLTDAYENGNKVKLESDVIYNNEISRLNQERQEKELQANAMYIEAKLRSYASIDEMEEQSKLKRLSIIKELYDGLDVMTDDAIKAQQELAKQTIEAQSKLSISHILIDDKEYIDALVKIELAVNSVTNAYDYFLQKLKEFNEYGHNVIPSFKPQEYPSVFNTTETIAPLNFTVSEEELKRLKDFVHTKEESVKKDVEQIKTDKEILNDLKVRADAEKKNNDLMLSHISQVSKMSDLELKIKQNLNKKEFEIFLQQANLVEISEKEKYELRLQALRKFVQDQESVRLEGKQRELANISQPISTIEGGFSKYFRGNKSLANELKQYQEKQLEVERDININRIKDDDNAAQKLALIWKSYYVQLEDLNRKWSIQTGNAFDGIKEGLREFVEEAKTDAENLKDLAKGTAEAASSSFSDLFFDTFTGKMKSGIDYVRSFGQAFARIISDMAAKAMIAKFLDFSGFGNKLSENTSNSAHNAGLATEVSLDSQLTGTLAGLTSARYAHITALQAETVALNARNSAASSSVISSGSFGSSSGSTGAEAVGGVVAHAGGMIEKFHNGGKVKLLHDEVPAILQTKERVLSREQNKNFEALMKSINRGYTPQYKKGYFHNGGLIQSFSTGGPVPNWSGMGIPFGGSTADYYNPQGNVGIKPTAGSSGSSSGSGMNFGNIMAIAGASSFVLSFIMSMLKKKPKKEHPGMSEYYVRQHEGGVVPFIPRFHNGGNVSNLLGQNERILGNYNFDDALSSNLNKVKSQKIVIENKNNEQILRNLLENNKSLPRFHDGLNPDEFSGVLKKGERVLSNKQDKVFKDMSKYVSSRQNEKQQETKVSEVQQNVNFTVNAMDSKSFGQYLQENRSQLSGVLRGLAKDNVLRR